MVYVSISIFIGLMVQGCSLNEAGSVCESKTPSIVMNANGNQLKHGREWWCETDDIVLNGEGGGNWKMGKRVGKWEYWNKNGILQTQQFYKDGKRNGRYTHWFINGIKGTEGAYKDGHKDGLWIYWETDGVKVRETTYKMGIEEGSKQFE